MINGKSSNNEENIINTTVVELFALMIFLFILALAAFILSGEAPRDVEDPYPIGTLPSKKGGILIMPMFEGIPACIYHVKAVEYDRRTGASFRFKDISSPLLFRMSLETVIDSSDPADWMMTLRDNHLKNEPDSIVPFEKAWCAFYQQKTVRAVEMGTDPGERAMQCTLRSELQSPGTAEFADIAQSMRRPGEDELNVYQQANVYQPAIGGAREWYNTWARTVSMADLIEFSHGSDTACRWGIVLEASNYCADGMGNETEIAIARLNYINEVLGYNFKVVERPILGSGSNAGEVGFEGCKERVGVDRSFRPAILEYANPGLL